MPSTEHAWAFETTIYSINLLWNNFKPFRVNEWILDSGGFTQITKYGRYICTPKWYVWRIERLRQNGELVGAFCQDWQCMPIHLNKTGLTKEDHQEKTTQSYVDLKPLTTVEIIPVLQGQYAKDYANHVKMYGNLLGRNAWVGVGGVAARQNQPGLILKILEAIKSERADLRIHGFGLKWSSLQYETIVDLLHSSDSQNWAMNERWNNREKFTTYGTHDYDVDTSDPRLAMKFAYKLQALKGVDNIVYGERKSFKRTTILKPQAGRIGLFEKSWEPNWKTSFKLRNSLNGQELNACPRINEV
jgi:hypothetical protein